jgi:hypothetical protein
LQLPSIPGGLPSICNLRMHHAVVTRDPPNMGKIDDTFEKTNKCMPVIEPKVEEKIRV